MDWFFYLATGACTGILAGLFGVGGGVIVVPMLTFSFTAQGFTDVHILHLAIGTSLASIIFTSISSLLAHSRRGAVNWPVVKGITPGILAGTFFGTCLAARLSSGFLKGFFVVFLFYVAARMFFSPPSGVLRHLPGKKGLFGAGALIGGISSLVGIGGGGISVPFLAWCGLPIRHAVGTSAAMGLPIALAGTIGYLVNGTSAPGLPPEAIGFVHLPALMGIALASICTAPLGTRLAYILPVGRLKKGFALFLVLVALRMLVSLF